MSKRLVGVIAMPAVYFGLILTAAVFVAAELITEIHVWLLPIFAVIAVGSAVVVGDIRLLDVAVTFLISILIFPIGVLYAIGAASKIESPQIVSIIASNTEMADWLLIVSPLVAAIVMYFVLAQWRRKSSLMKK